MSGGFHPGDTSWYAGRFARRRGSHGAVDVLASESAQGWEAIANPRKLFPKSGQVEMLGLAASTLRPGDWLAFRVVANARPGAPSQISTHRLLPRYVDMGELGSIEATRGLFMGDGWPGGHQPGHWAVRFSADRLLVLDLAREGDNKLRSARAGLQSVPSYDFDAAQIMSEPASVEPVFLYDLGESAPLSVHDWSADADYIAHIVRSLAGESDPRLGELIAWLELHRDERTGRVSATGADVEKGFEALRSGELAARLSADRILMGAYLSAVRDDPAVARAVADAAAQAATGDREAVIAALRSELAADHEREQARQDEALRERERSLQEALVEHIKSRGEALERELQDRIAAATSEAEACAAARNEALLAETATLRIDRDALLAEREKLQGEIARLGTRIAGLTDEQRVAEEELARLSSAAASLTRRAETPARTLAVLATDEEARGSSLAVDGLAAEISRNPLLTRSGKSLMERFAALLLAGELPVLEGGQVDDFTLVAEALIAAGRLVPFDADSTILTPEDIWSRPGSGIDSPVAQASTSAQDGEGTFLVALRGIDRSAARAWYPALATLTRRGLLPRRLMLFATVIDENSEEARALPGDAYRLKIQGAVEPNAYLVAPALLGSGRSAIAFELDPGDRPGDLSTVLPILSELGTEVDVGLSLRIARLAFETMRMRPSDSAAALNAAREFCAATSRKQQTANVSEGERKNA